MAAGWLVTGKLELRELLQVERHLLLPLSRHTNLTGVAIAPLQKCPGKRLRSIFQADSCRGGDSNVVDIVDVVVAVVVFVRRGASQ